MNAMKVSIGEQEKKPESVLLLGVKIHTLTLPSLLDNVEQNIVLDHHSVIGYANVFALNLAYKNPWFRAFLNSCAVVFCDGFGVKLGSSILGAGRLHRYTPPDWLPALLAMCSQKGYSVYILGAQPGVAQKAAERLLANHPGLQIVGTNHGYFDKTKDCAENQVVVQNINAAHPNILLIGFGMPLQEHWLLENWESISANVALPVGAAIDYLAGAMPRAPRWMTDHGLEWLGRLVIEPRRLWKRYLIGNPVFFWRIMLQKLGWLKFPN